MKGLSECTILIVDDTKANIDILVALLGNDYDISVAMDGQSALANISDNPPDLILLDIIMPVMDGYQVLEELKNNPKFSKIPVIMISAIDEMASIIKCIKMGAEDYLPKPFNAVLLQARIGAVLEKKRLRDKERLYAKSLEFDLEIGRQIQNGFFPDSLPLIEGWQIVTHFQAARQVSGDFYDVFKLSNDSGVGFVIADVCDKGVGAALFMALFHSLIRAFSELHYGMGLPEILDKGVPDHSHWDIEAQQLTKSNHTSALEIIFSQTNNYIASTHNKSNMFATLFGGILEPESGMLSYINGGHVSVAVVESKGIRTMLEPTGPAVGMLPDMVFEAKRIKIYPGEFLVAFTDGITEARDAGGEFYGEDKLMQLLTLPADSAEDMLSRITTSLAAYTSGAEQSDDITMMIIHRC